MPYGADINVEALPLAHFLVMLPADSGGHLVERLSDVYAGASVRAHHVSGAALVCVERGGRRVFCYVCPRGRGWVVLKGMLHDTLTDRAADEACVADAIFVDSPDLNRFEGEFAAVIHDARRGITWALNDHASQLHLYYAEVEGGVCMTTAPLAAARALSLGLDPSGVRQLLGRGQVICPASLYTGVRRLGVGEHLRWLGGHPHVGRHWSPYLEPRAYSTRRAAAEATAGVLLEVTKRYARRGPVVADLSGGYDSRLVASALSRAGAALTVTVNGHGGHPDVVLARRVANVAGWPLLHYGASFSGEMTAAIRREAAYMSRGELGALSFYLHLLTRPGLGRHHVMHVQGGGGELLRSFPWSQEFAGIGRRRKANVDRVVRYRLLANRVMRDSLFAAPFGTALLEELGTLVRLTVEEGAGTLTTQQLDAVYLLRLTGHFGAFTTSLYDLLPTGSPLMQRTMIEHAVTLPWKMRLGAGLLRRTTALLHPGAASVETAYGGTAGPPSLATLPMEVKQVLSRARHLVDKLDRVALGGRLGQSLPLAERLPARPDPPFRTEEFRKFLDPSRMYSRGLYREESVTALLADPDTPMEALSRIATLEHVCRELGVEPGPELLTA